MTRSGSSVEMEESAFPPGLIMPKKVHNPCLDSVDRQNLHRELLFNQKMGRNVLNQKSELQRAIEKHRENQTKKELEQKKMESRTPLQRVIEQRAKRLEILERSGSDDESTEQEPTSTTKPEFLEIHARLRAKMEAK